MIQKLFSGGQISAIQDVETDIVKSLAEIIQKVAELDIETLTASRHFN
jgi:hypothetical protein